MFEEDELLPISALQHLIFCDRQAALIHLERVWLDNPFTVEGHDLHRIVDEGEAGVRGDVRVLRSVTISTKQLGLTGKADVIEFHPIHDDRRGVRLSGSSSSWRPVPVEYKRGKPKAHRADEVQLCAQVIAIEETLGVDVPEGVLFYGTTRRRQNIPMDRELREVTEATAVELHSLIRSGRTPLRAWDRRCRHCSLLPICLPPRRRRPKSARAYLSKGLEVPPADAVAP